MPWYESSTPFTVSTPVPDDLRAQAGPHGVALVDVYPDGRTSAGWGLTAPDGKPGFMENYANKRFWERPRAIAARKNRKPFAIVMRSVNVIAVDIDRHTDDGSPDGFRAAAKLDLPVTLAQTSKSGHGRHLFYRTNETWDEKTGFGHWDDVIGLVPGVDVRAVGCIYRHATQHWVPYDLAEIPEQLTEMLEQRRERRLAAAQQRAAIAAAPPDDEEALIMHDALLRELDQPIRPGKRNTTLFAIGSKMQEAGFPGWEDQVTRRADEVGLSQNEASKLVSNIIRYGGN